MDLRLADGDHVVQFFEHDEELTATVVQWSSTAILDGGAAVLVTTPAHRAAFHTAMIDAGVDVDSACADGRLVIRDAAETLARCTPDGRLDAAAFDSVVGGVVRQAVAAGRRVCGFGEMVVLLWEAGNTEAAVELERLWNSLFDDLPFSLLCAYPSHLFRGAEAADAVSEICRLHSDVVGGAAAVDAEVTRRFAATSTAPGSARRFVAETLLAWGRSDLLDDCMLVVSEFATNAVRHARSDFTVALSRSDGGIHVCVGDSSPAPPTPRAAGPGAPGGRGLRLVDAVAVRWGHVPAGSGKVVWAHVADRGRDER